MTRKLRRGSDKRKALDRGDFQFMSESPARIERQKEFYRLLQHLGRDRDNTFEQQLGRALAIIVEMSGARQGYLEIRGLDGEPVFQSHSMSDDDLASVRESISSGIIAQAIQSGEPIATSTAFLDPRFDAMESVRLSNIESVLCAPFQGDQAQGVVYLQGDSNFDPESGKVKLDARAFADHIVPFLDQVLLEYEQKDTIDPTFVLRKRFRLQDIIGSSKSLYQVLQAATTIAPLDVNVLLTGESGTGKTQIAQAIHRNSKRAKHPFVELNCGAIQDTLFESELFGTVRGAFNDARDKPGKVLAAEQGTLFLDEIGELSLAAQAKLLQFMQSGEFYPVGSDQKVTSDVRVLCATNRYLEELVHLGEFRKDLFFRINTFSIRIPTLNEREEDIRQLAEHFCQLKCIKHDFPQLNLATEVLNHLSQRKWPGNIRELDNLIESACIHAVMENATTIELRHTLASDGSTNSFQSGQAPDLHSYSGQSFQNATKSFQRQFLQQSLQNNNGSVTKTAQELGLSKSHMYNLINEFALGES